MRQNANPATTKPDNPLLCSGCQPWDDCSYKFRHFMGNFVLVQDVLDDVQCIVCKAAMKSVATRTSHMGVPQTSRVFFHNRGPYSLGPVPIPRLNASDPEETGDCFVMDLAVRVHSIVPTVPTEEETQQTQFEMTPQFCLRFQNRDACQSLKSVEPYEVPFFSISLLKDWIQNCTDSHGAACEGKIQAELGMEPLQYKINSVELSTDENVDELPQGFRVINLGTMNVEEPATALSYVALSYMWPSERGLEHVQLERSNLHMLEQPGGLDQIALPPVITDTMLLCKQLGENYLWVDRLCIIQDDTDSKHGQIRGMDRIYRSADLTIIAALNDRDTHGLPGLANRPRLPSIYMRLPLDLAEMMGGFVKSGELSAADESVWNTRGWTFQERVLPTRRLYITEHQVLFECPRGYDSEVESSYSLRARREKFRFRTTDRKWFHRREAINYHITHDTSVQDYLTWVTNYTSRQFSVGSDILNAFAGISGLLDQMIGSDCLFGLPEKFLVQALMWTASDNIEMRTGMPANIPSWSWASSPSKVDYEWITRDKEDCLCVISLVYFNFQDPSQGLRRAKVQEWWVEREMPIEDFASRDDVPPIETIGPKYLPSPERTNLTWKCCPHNPWQTLLHTTLDPEACRVASTLPGALVFNTTVATLILDCPKKGEFDLKGGLFIRRFMNGLSQKYDKWDDKFGRIFGPFPRGLDSKKLAEKKQDIIVICGALTGRRFRRTGIRWGLPPGFDLWQLHVMFIERDEANPFIARRVGVGYIEAHMWEELAPKWETVVLC